MYHPKLGRFLQTDPVGYEDQMNLYAYVANDPVNNVDPSGKFIFTAITIGLIAYSAYDGYQSGGATGALAEASGYNDAMDSISSFQSGDYSGAAAAAAAIVCKACKAGNKLKSLKNNSKVGDIVKTPDNSEGAFTKLKGGQGFKDKKTGTLMQRSNTDHTNKRADGGEWKAGNKPGETPTTSNKTTITGGANGGCVLKRDGC